MPKFKPLDAVEIHQHMMRKTGVWPEENPDLFYKSKTVFSCLIGIAMFTMMCIEAFSNLNDFTKVSEILYIWAATMAYLAKLGVFIYHGKTVRSLIDFLQHPIFNSYPDDLNHYMERSVKTTTFITRFYQYSVVALVILYVAYPILDHVPLPFPLPYDLGKYRLVMFAFQLIGSVNGCWNNSTIDSLSFALMGVAAAQLDILAAKIMNAKQMQDTDLESNEESCRKDEPCNIEYLKECIEHHLAIIKLVDEIENIFTGGLLAQFLTSAIIICNTSFYFVLIPISLEFAMLADYIVVVILQLFMYCWYGNKIMLKSLHIGDACYDSNWHLCNSQVRKYLFIIMERSKRPLKIGAWKFSTLTLAALLSILRWSYSLLTLLLNMYHKRSTE